MLKPDLSFDYYLNKTKDFAYHLAIPLATRLSSRDRIEKNRGFARLFYNNLAFFKDVNTMIYLFIVFVKFFYTKTYSLIFMPGK